MFTLNDFRENDRVQLHPATDLWMRGARYGTVRSIGRKQITVEMDCRKNWLVSVAPHNICEILA
jgi:hypothetical protein